MRSLAPRKLLVLPNLVPMVDVSLLLVAVYVALAPMFERQLPLSLPPVEVEAAEHGLPPGQVVVRAGVDLLTMNGVPVEDEKLGEILSASLAGQPERIVLLDAQPELPYERVVFLLDIFRQAGARAVGLTPELTTFLTPAPESAAASPAENGAGSSTEVAP